MDDDCKVAKDVEIEEDGEVVRGVEIEEDDEIGPVVVFLEDSSETCNESNCNVPPPFVMTSLCVVGTREEQLISSTGSGDVLDTLLAEYAFVSPPSSE